MYTSSQDPSSIGQQLEGRQLLNESMPTAWKQMWQKHNNGTVWQKEAGISSVSLCANMWQGAAKKESVKYSGVKIDNKLNWKLYLDDVQKKCLAKTAVIRARACLPHNDKKMLYQTFVLSISITLQSSGTHGATLTKRIERVQNYALRMILQKSLRKRSNDLQTKLNMITLEHRWRNNMILNYLVQGFI